MLKIATLFSGIGAIEETLNKMNIAHEVIFACDNGEREIDIDVDTVRDAIKNKDEIDIIKYIEKIYSEKSKKKNLMQLQYLANFNVKNNRYYQDVRFLDGSVYESEKIDLLVGGSPCQSFSIIGKRGGFEDTRGTLFYEYARIVKECKPKIFIYENVLGMLSHDKGKTWETVINVFQELGYNYKVFQLNSKDYGIPQDRKRIFVVGTLVDNIMDKPEEKELNVSIKDFLDKEVLAKYYLGRKGFEFVTNPKYINRAKVNGDIMVCQKANQQFNWNGDFVFEPLDLKKHTEEILTRAYVGIYKGVRGVCRQLTPRECLRLMGFSEQYSIAVNDTTAWRQSGNAIVVDVLESIIKELLKKELLIC